MTGKAIKTRGVGKPAPEYLNLSVTLADAETIANEKKLNAKVRKELWRSRVESVADRARRFPRFAGDDGSGDWK